MRTLFLPLAALLLSVFILLIGHGVQQTVVPLYALEIDWSPTVIAYTGSAYFLGFIIGCLTIPRLVTGVGHIRVFVVLVSCATAVLLALPLLPVLGVWLVCRLVTGWAFAGLYMVIESWLNESTTAENRGLVLSIYTTLTLVSISIGQLAINIDLPYQGLISIGAILLVLGAVPVGLTRSPAPAPIPSVGFRIKEVYRASHVAVIAALVGGMATSGYWVLGPVIASRLSLSPAETSLFLAAAIYGGAILQLPAGRLSDKLDRRLVLAGLGLLGAAVSLLIIFVGDYTPLLYPAMFIYGGTTFTLYAISLAHANDNTQLPMIEIGSVILLLHSAGAVLGPVVISALMTISDVGMFWFSAILLAGFGLWSIWRSLTHVISRQHFEAFQDTPKTSIEVFEILQADDDDERAGSP